MIYNNQTAIKTADLLLQIKAIKLNPQTPYKWSSGWLSPIYTDNRVTLSYPEIRTYLKQQFADIIREKFPDCEMIAGVATAGIAHGALVADALNLPYCYVRSAPKSHGMNNMIEGRVVEGQKIVVLEDLISTGGSSLNVVKALQAEKCQVLGLIAIFTYAFEAAETNFANAACPFYTLTDYPHLIERALTNNHVEQQDILTLQAWRMHPDTWSRGL